MCQDNLNLRFTNMDFSVEVIALQNTYLIANATAYQERCSNEQNNKLKAIRKYKLALSNASMQIIFNTSCPSNVTTNLNSLYSNAAETTNQATIVTAQYGNSNEITWQMAYDSMQARAAYDNAYWANKTQQLQDWYVSQGLSIDYPDIPSLSTGFSGFNTDLSDYWACATVSNLTCPYPDGLKARADATVAQFQAKYATLSTNFYATKNASQAYLNSASAKLAGYQSYATTVSMKLADIKQTVEDLKASCGGACNADVDRITANFPFKPDVFVTVPDINYSIPSFSAPNWTEVMAGLDFGNATQAVKDKLAAMTFQVNALSNGWTDTLDTNILNQFNWSTNFSASLGYNPPGVGIDVGNVTNLTKNYVNQTNAQLGDVAARLSPGSSSSTGNKTSVLRDLRLDTNSLSKNEYSYEMLGGSFDIDLWFFSVNWLKFFSYFFDYAWRIWYSGRIFIRYWFGAAGTMPPIDIRSYRTTKATPLHIVVARYATHPLVLFGGGLIVACLVVSVIIGLYVPMLTEYIQTCVKADAAGQPSFISDNVYAAAFNVAVLQGNRDLSQGLNQYDTGRANLCGTTQQNANDAYANQQYQLRIVRDNLQTTVSLLDDMERCTLGTTWTQLTPFVTYTNYPAPAEPWHIPNCSMAGFDALGFLEPPPINCTALPSCGTQCGVDVAVVQGVSRKASCQTEWYVHTTILQTVCTLVVFIFWNVCRTLLLDGLVRIYWRHLVRGSGLNFYSTCNRNGQIDNNTEDQLGVAIKQSDISFRRMGYFYIVMSFLLNIPYIVFCVLLNIDIAYPY